MSDPLTLLLKPALTATQAYNTRNRTPIGYPTPTNPMPSGLLGPNPADAKAQAFLQGIGAMAPGLLMAGAPSLDPGNRQRGYAMAFQGLQQGQQGALDRVRAQNLQELQFEQAQQKAMMDKQELQIKLNKHNQLLRLLPQQPNQASNNQLAAVAPTSKVLDGNIQSSQPMTMPVQTGSNVSPVNLAQPQQSTVNIDGVNVPSAVVRGALLSNDPGTAISQYLAKATDPKLEMLDNKLTGFGKMKQEDTLRKELNPVTKAFSDADRFYQIVTTQLAKSNGTADIAGLNALIKMIDQGMVTVGEVELQTYARDLRSQIVGTIDNLKAGAVLTSDGNVLRKNMIDTATDLLNAMHTAHRKNIDGYRYIATDRKLDFRKIFTMSGIYDKKNKKTNAQSGSSQVPGKKPLVPNTNKSTAPLHKKLDLQVPEG